MKSKIMAVCKANAKGANRKQRRANAVQAYKRVMAYVKKADIMPDSGSMETTSAPQAGQSPDSTGY